MNNKNLLQVLSLGMAIVLLSACGSKSLDKTAQLAALKDQKAKIEAEIAALEKEIGATGNVQRVKTVGLTELSTGIFRHYIDLQGKVDAEENVPVTAKMPGKIGRAHV